MTRAFVLALLLGACGPACSTTLISGVLAADEEEKINGRSLSTLAAALNNTEFRQGRCSAMEDIARYATKPKQFIPNYHNALLDPDEVVRATAAQTLGHMGQRLPSLVNEFLPELSAALEDPQVSVRNAATFAFVGLGPAGRSQLPALRQRYEQDKSARVRESALSAIVAVTQGSDDYLDALLMAVGQTEFRTQANWLEALARAGGKPEQVVPALRKALSNKDDSPSPGGNRQIAVHGLGHLRSPKARDAVGDLFKILEEPIQYREIVAKPVAGEPRRTTVIAKVPTNFWLRLAAAWAIARIDAESIPKLFDVLERQMSAADSDVRLSSLLIVCRLLPMSAAKQCAGRIKMLTADPDANVRTIARLAELRLADPNTKPGYEGMPLSRLPLPDDPAESDRAVQRARLKQRVDEIKKLCEVGDTPAALRSTTLPTTLERALLQGDLVFEAMRPKELIAATTALEQIQSDKAQIAGRQALVPCGASRQPFRFHWFARDWYLAE